MNIPCHIYQEANYQLLCEYEDELKERSGTRYLTSEDVKTNLIKGKRFSPLCITTTRSNYLTIGNACPGTTVPILREKDCTLDLLASGYECAVGAHDTGYPGLIFNHSMFSVPKDSVFLDDVMLETFVGPAGPVVTLGLNEDILKEIFSPSHILKALDSTVDSFKKANAFLNLVANYNFNSSSGYAWFDITHQSPLYAEEFGIQEDHSYIAYTRKAPSSRGKACSFRGVGAVKFCLNEVYDSLYLDIFPNLEFFNIIDKNSTPIYLQ